MAVSIQAASAARNVDLVSPVLTQAEIEREISSYSAEEIEAMSKAIVVRFMEQLQIDLSKTKITGVASFSNGDRAYVVARVPQHETDKRKQFIELCLPVVKDRLREAFSTPLNFLRDGVHFALFNRSDSGIINQFSTREFDLYGRELLGRYSGISQMICIEAGETFSLDQNQPKSKADFRFSVRDPYSHHALEI